MGRSREIRGLTAGCVLMLALTACGSPGNSGQGEVLQESSLPSAEPSPEATEVTEIADRSDCRETVRLPTDSTESIAPSADSATASSCGTRSVPLTEEQMRSATPAPMPLKTLPVPNGNSADSQVTTPKDGEQREWTTERMRSASPEPMPRIP
jgi:hypothetical protein